VILMLGVGYEVEFGLLRAHGPRGVRRRHAKHAGGTLVQDAC
jgi:hypothetical protein